MQIGRRLARQDTEELNSSSEPSIVEVAGKVWDTLRSWQKKLRKSRAEQQSFCLEIRYFFWGISERSIVYPHLWHVLISICGQALSYVGSSEYKYLGSSSWTEEYAEGWPLYCEHKTKNDASLMFAEREVQWIFSEASFSSKCYDSVINLLNKLIVQTGFKGNVFTIYENKLFKYPFKHHKNIQSHRNNWCTNYKFS